MAETVIAVAAVVGTVATVAGTAYSAYESGQAHEEASKAAEEAAAREAEKTELAIQEEEERHRRILATQEAKYAYYGVSISDPYGMVGSPLDVRAASLRQAERDIEAIRIGGEAAEESLLSESRWEKHMGKSTTIGGYMEAGSSLLTGAGTVAGLGKEYRWW